MLFAWSTIVTSLISQIWWFESGFKGSGYRFCNVFVSNIAAFTVACRLLLSIKITIVLSWTIPFRNNRIWSRMIFLNKACHIVGKRSRECQCVFVTEDLSSGRSPGLFDYVLPLQRRSSSRGYTSRAAPLSSPAFLHKLILPLNKFSNYTRGPICPSTTAGPQPMPPSCLPCAPTTYPLFSAPQHMLVHYLPTESTSLLVLLIFGVSRLSLVLASASWAQCASPAAFFSCSRCRQQSRVQSWKLLWYLAMAYHQSSGHPAAAASVQLLPHSSVLRLAQAGGLQSWC